MKKKGEALTDDKGKANSIEGQLVSSDMTRRRRRRREVRDVAAALIRALALMHACSSNLLLSPYDFPQHPFPPLFPLSFSILTVSVITE